jgi:hypothetical protein
MVDLTNNLGVYHEKAGVYYQQCGIDNHSLGNQDAHDACVFRQRNY